MRLRLAKLLCLAAIALVGCATGGEQTAAVQEPAATNSQVAATSPPVGQPQTTAQQPPEQVAAVAATPAAAQSAAPAAPQVDEQQQVDQLLGQLESSGQMTHAIAEQLAGDLQRADPMMRALLMQHLRASLAHQPQPQTPRTPPADTVSPHVLAQNLPTPTQPTQAVMQTAARPPDPPLVEMPPDVVAAPLGPPPPWQQVPMPESNVQLASATAPIAKEDFVQQVTATIASLETGATSPIGQSRPVQQEVYLRILHLLAGRRDEALRPIEGLPQTEQDYWTNQLYALATYLDSQQIPDPASRAAEAQRHLARASQHLGEASLLTVKNLAFCTEVTSYGIYQKFDEYRFRPGQRVLLYTELDNFHSEPTPRGYHTSLRSSYQIFDSRGQRVAGEDLAITEEHCRNPRRDYFIRYFLSMPTRLYDGRYTLQLTIEDTLARKIGQSTIEFDVSENPGSSAPTWPVTR